ncbi:MAG: flagellar biosynthesis protein FlhB [Treponema sp.]|nr:flagellar biosynthesis protein FlhB [Treponema sp.]
MAAEDEGRTEEPSEYKLEKARKEGRVAKSQEVSGALILLFGVITIIAMSKFLLEQLTQIMTFYFSRCTREDVNNPSFMMAFLNFFLKCVVPVGIVSFVAAILGNIIQTRGFIFSLKPIEPKFSKIVPKIGEYLKKTVFSTKGLFNVAKSLGKVALIIIVAYVFIRKDIFVLVEIIKNGDISGALVKIAKMAAQILLTVAVLFLVISIPDYFVQRHDFMEEMKMTKQEQKEEYKEMEGDPEVKSRLQQMQRQMLQQNIPKAVAESDVVIANPTHFAVALKFDTEAADAPMVNAKGEDNMAFTIRRIAEENNIPVVENRPVARDLYTNLEVGDIIPDNYIRAVALIYAQLDKYKNANS